MNKLLSSILFLCISYYATAQSGYEISIELKNNKDTLAYLTYYQFKETYIKDTCTSIKNNKIIFKGKNKLDKGIYSLVSQDKKLLFDFFIDDNTQNLSLKSEAGDNISNELVALNSDKENVFFNYIKFIGQQNKDFITFKNEKPLKTKKDTLALVEKQKDVEKSIRTYEKNLLLESKRTYIGDVINLKMEAIFEEAKSKKEEDKLKAYIAYKNHYWDNVNFDDDATARNPFFYNKLNKYFNSVVITHPDSVSVEIDRMLNKTKEGGFLYKLLLSHFTYTYETSKIMGFDKVFVHMADNYFKRGKAQGVYEDEDVVEKIIKRANQLRPLLVGAVAQDLFMIRAEDFGKMKEMGFENAKNSEEITKVFYKNVNEVNKMFVKLSDVKADYTILVFWDVDCGHCQKEIPKILDAYNELIKEKKNVKVFSVYMQHEGEKYLKYIDEHKLPWINVYDGAHYNNTQDKYDVVSTPVTYILDKNKVIKAKHIGAEQIKDIIKAIEQENKENLEAQKNK